MNDDSYVHDPDGVMEDTNADSTADEQEFDWRGWTLVGLIVVCFVVIPGAILLNPPALPFKVAYLVLPLIPAFVLGVTAVWATATK